jgi:hypothetical protein
VTDVVDIKARSPIDAGARGAAGVEIGMLRCRLATVPLVFSLLIVSCTLAAAGQPRALLELFTSQGCSSCPPADKLLGEFANDPSIVALSVPINYWDYLGWRDTLALAGHAVRQRAYARVRGDREVYTPQVVVNGVTHVVGSDRPAIERAIAQTDRNAAVMSLPVLLTLNAGALNVKLSGGKEHTAGEVWLCPLSKAVPVSIDRGENSGRTITYHNVVRRWLRLGEWSGSDETLSVPLADFLTDEVNAAAVMVQQGTREKPGIILGAAIAPVGQLTTDNGAPPPDKQ